MVSRNQGSINRTQATVGAVALQNEACMFQAVIVTRLERPSNVMTQLRSTSLPIKQA